MTPFDSFGDRAFQYAYDSQLNRIASIVEPVSGFARRHTYDAVRGLLSSVESELGVTTLARFVYRHDELGRRTDVAKSGQLYNLYGPDGLVERYAYNNRNELLSAHTFVGSDPVNLALPALPGRAFDFGYDNQGNRTSENETSDLTLMESIGANTLNQAHSVQTKSVMASGVVAPGARVAVGIDGGAPVETQQQGDYWSVALEPNNANAYQATLDIYAGAAGDVSHEQRQVFVPDDVEIDRTYDDDGNTSEDGRWRYTFDARNRLVEMESLTAYEPSAGGGYGLKRVLFDYDYLGRRWQKETLEYQAGAWTTVSKIKYVYATESFNLITELDGLAADIVMRTYTWGKDLSGTLNGAGGVGGLLMVSEAGTDYLVSYDGNGNVVALTNAATGELAAAYEYSPYGKLIRSQGPMADKNPFRFSTKYQDQESGLCYYGYRYYDPERGRFINRDPIEEAGSFNLYAAFGNDPINRIDYLGMSEISINGGLSLDSNIWTSSSIWRGRNIRLRGTTTFNRSLGDQAFMNIMANVAQNISGSYRKHLIGTLGDLRGVLKAAESLGEYNEALGKVAKQVGVAIDKVQDFFNTTLGPILGTDNVDIPLFTKKASCRSVHETNGYTSGDPKAIAAWEARNPTTVSDVSKVENPKLKTLLNDQVFKDEVAVLEDFRHVRFKKTFGGKYIQDPTGNWVQEKGSMINVVGGVGQRVQLDDGSYYAYSNYSKANAKNGKMTTRLAGAEVLPFGGNFSVSLHTHPWGTVPSLADTSSTRWSVVISELDKEPTLFIQNPKGTSAWNVPTCLVSP